MALTLVIATFLLCGLAQAGTYPPDAVDDLAAVGLANLKTYTSNVKTSHHCTLETAAKRYEWSDLSVQQREDYIDAVLCLQSLPPRLDSVTVPGARSRFDDFVAEHINVTLSVHITANFLTWHRYFTWLYEQALREECGYKGYQPYWNWGRYALDPINSPIFNGNMSSMSGNGEYFKYDGLYINKGTPPFNYIPPDQGGGCVTSGPFKNMTVNLGPVSPETASLNVPANSRKDGFGYNPRCLRRDINRHVAVTTTTNYTVNLIANSPDIKTFQNVLQGQASIYDWGLHNAGHFTIGGDPGGDFYTSPGDPAFYLHHAQVDRVFWIWQLQQLPERLFEVSGTMTIADTPHSRNGTLDDFLEMGVLGEPLRLGDAMNTLGGAHESFCYIYV